MVKPIEKIIKELPFTAKKVMLIFGLSFVFWLIVSAGFTRLAKIFVGPCDKTYLKLLIHQPQILSFYILLYCSFSAIIIWFSLIKKIKGGLGFFFNRANFKQDSYYGFELFVKSLGFIVLFLVLLVFLMAVMSKILGLDYHGLKNAYLQGKDSEINDFYRIYKFNAIIIFLAVVFGPIYEEIFFRGCLYTALRKELSMTKSIVLSSLFFALIHGYIFNFFPVFLLGMMLAYSYEKKASLTAPLTLHLCWNWFSALFMLLKI